MACLEDYASSTEKIRALEQAGQLIRLKRGLYVASNEAGGAAVDARICANHIYGPSYVSFQWALRWYGLIPEQVYTLTSATTKRSRTFENPLGRFTYQQVTVPYFSIGIQSVKSGNTSCLMASPEKALCDTILHTTYLPPQSAKGLSVYLEEDLRMDIGALKTFDIRIIEECAAVGRKKTILNNLIKIIKQ